jgi:ABC-type uncharacterized transport system involved in gliding motility auxiliary subunit
VEGLAVKRLVAILGWLGVALVLAAVTLRFSRPDLVQYSRGLALGGLVVLVAYMLTQWRDVARSFGGRNVKYGSIAASSVVIVLGILVGINWIANREHKRWDLTAANQFSLSDQTKKVLGELKKPLTIQAFYASSQPQGGSAQEFRDRLSEYTYLSKQVSADYIDADRSPTEAQKAGVERVPTIVLTYEGRTERANAVDEQSITNALKKVIEGKAKKVYFVQGHGERDPMGSDPNGYTTIADSLRNDNFEIAKLQLAQEGKIPDDASVVVVAGPKTDLLAAETDLLRAYLKKGGKVLLLVDPPDKGTAAPVTNVIALAHEWGVDLGNDIVVDASGLGQLLGTNASVPIAMPEPHPITENFRVMTAFPLARSAAPVDGGVNGHTAQKLLQTSPQSWAESDIKGLYDNGRPEENVDKGDKAGPIAIASAVSAPVTDAAPGAAADAPKPESRVVVVGDSDFAANRAIGLQGNREIFLNMTNWLAQQEDLIAIRPKNPEDRPISMTADQTAMVFWFTMIIIPVLLFVNGVRVWWRKR